LAWPEPPEAAVAPGRSWREGPRPAIIRAGPSHRDNKKKGRSMKRNYRYESIVIRPNTQVSFSDDLKGPQRHTATAGRWVLATLVLAVFVIATGLSGFLV
jgi:hypothetical protein